MCSRRVVMFLLCASVVAALVALGSETYAGCSKPPCAATYLRNGACICCTTGSEVFNLTAVGMPGWFVNSCPAGQNCLRCSVFGTAGSVCNPTILDPTCGVEGVLFCVNHGGNAAKAQGQPFTFDAVLGGTGNFKVCDHAGKCTALIEVTGQPLPDVCINPNWNPVAFTASKFNGECCACQYGYDVNGTCCGDANRSLDHTCSSTGTETCTADGFRCSVNPVPNPGDKQPYQCCLLSELVFPPDHPEGVCPQQ